MLSAYIVQDLLFIIPCKDNKAAAKKCVTVKLIYEKKITLPSNDFAVFSGSAGYQP